MSGIERTHFLHAIAPVFVATIVIGSAPVMAQEPSGVDFLLMQQKTIGDAATEPAAPETQAPLPAPATTASSPRPGHADQSYLEEVAQLQREIARLKLELTKAGLEAEIKAARAASADPAPAAVSPGRGTAPTPVAVTPAPPPPPTDDPADLPTVISVIGAGGVLKAELKTAEGGRLAAREGDVLPGGFEITTIDRGIVTARSLKTEIEYRLAGDTTAAAATASRDVASEPVETSTLAEPEAPADEDEVGEIYIIPDPQ